MLVGMGIILGISLGILLCAFILEHPDSKIARLLLDDD